MTTVKLALASDGTTVNLSRRQILRLAPDSLLANVLTHDSSVEEIRITNPEITKNVLGVLAYIFKTGTIPEAKANPVYQVAANYFLFDILALIGDPVVLNFQKHYSLFPPSYDHVWYENAMRYGKLSPPLKWYIMRLYSPEQTRDVDQKLFLETIEQYSVDPDMTMIDDLLSRDVNPNVRVNDRPLIVHLIETASVDLFQRILSDPHTNIIGENKTTLIRLIVSGFGERKKLLLVFQDPKLRAQPNIGCFLLTWAKRHGYDYYLTSLIQNYAPDLWCTQHEHPLPIVRFM